MNCRKIQQLLLTSDHPDQPSADVRFHLADCPGCRSVQRRLVAAEQRIPLLPVPLSTGRNHFLEQIRQGVPVEPTISASELWLGSHSPPKERGLRKLALALALAASLAVFALSWWAWPHRSVPTLQTHDPLAARQQDRDRRLTQARTPAERVQVLTDLAQGLHQEALQLARKSDKEELRVVARFYREVVRDNLLEQARKLPRNERPMLKDVADHLNEVESEMLRRVAGEVEASAAAPLRDIAQAARESHDQLRQLILGLDSTA